MKRLKYPAMAHFSNKIKELKTKENVTAVEMEKGLGLSSGSWSRYERSLIIPSLSVAHKIADFFGVSLDELVGRDVDARHITLIRFKHAKKRLGQREFEKAWLLGKKVFELVSIDNHATRNKNMQIVEIIVNLLDESETSRYQQLLDKSFSSD